MSYANGPVFFLSFLSATFEQNFNAFTVVIGIKSKYKNKNKTN